MAIAGKEKTKVKKEKKSEGVTLYEVGFLLAPTIPVEKLPEEVGTIKALIEKKEGIFVSEEFPKLRVLAYKMVKEIGAKKFKFDQAYFGWVKFEMSSGVIKEVEEGLKKNENIVRFLLIKTVRESSVVIPMVSAMKKPDEGAIEAVPAENTKETSKETAEAIDKSIEKLVIE